MTTPREYVDAGLRILPVNVETKAPAMGGFGADHPDFCADPDEFESDETPAILCGPCPAGGDCWLVCLDLDGGLQLPDVERALGVNLPPTLESHGGNHVFYWVEPGDVRDALMQWTDVFGARRPDDRATGRKAAALDLKWAGGYAIERDDWVDGFDVDRIAVLPEAAAAGLVVAGRKKSVRPDREVKLPEDGSFNHDGLENRAQWEGAADRIVRFLLTRPTDTAGDGGAGLFSVCCQLRALFRIDSATMCDALRDVYVPRIPDLWTDEQLWHKIEDSKTGSLRAGLVQGEMIPEAIKKQLRAENPTLPPEPEAQAGPWCSAWSIVSSVTKIDYVCREIGLRNGRPSLWTADAMCGKSTLAAALAFAVATETPLWSRLDVEPCSVCYVTDEDMWGIARTLKRLALQQGLSIENYPGLHLSSAFTLGVGADQALLRTLLENHRLVIFDTLRSLSRAGGIEENDPRFAQGLYDLAELSDKTNTAVVVLHHNNKAGKSNGTAALFGAAGTRLEMTRAEQGGTVQVTGYARDGLRIEPFEIESDLHACPPPKDDPDSSGISFVYKVSAAGTRQVSSKIRTLAMRIQEMLVPLDRWVTAKEIEQAVGSKSDERREALALLVSEGKVGHKADGRTFFYHRDPRATPLT